MVKEIKELKKQQALKRNQSLKRSNDGRVIVDLRVLNDDSFLSPYSTEEHSKISGEMSDFIEHSLKSVHSDERIKLRFYSNAITDDEKVEYEQAIHSHYAECYRNTAEEKSRLIRIAFIMTFIAISALIFMIAIEFTPIGGKVFTEIIDIFAWVFMWEAVDIAFLQCAVLRHKEKRCLCLIDSIVEFLPITSVDK